MNKSSILKYAKSSQLMNIQIKVGNELISFNLYEELKIDDNVLNRELKGQAPSQAFLIIVHKNLIKEISTMELDLKKIIASKWTTLKEGNHGMTKDDIKNKIDKNATVIMMNKKLIKLVYQKDMLEACIKAFEQRSNMLQTLSANTRKLS